MSNIIDWNLPKTNKKKINKSQGANNEKLYSNSILFVQEMKNSKLCRQRNVHSRVYTVTKKNCFHFNTKGTEKITV